MAKFIPPPRPKKKGDYQHKLDPAQVLALASMQASDVEMAAVLGCSESVINRRKRDDPVFREAYENGRGQGRLRIKRSLFKQMEEGNVTAAIWLSKQYCGMRDMTALEVSGADGGPIQMEHAVSPVQRIAGKLALIAERRSAAGGVGGSDGSGSGGAGA